MSSISKQALLVENNTSFPDNNTGYITPAALRAFNVDMIDSTVNQATYSADLAGLQSDIAALEAFTASQQPSFAALNAFTASASSSIGLINQFTQSANAELDSLSAWTGSWNLWTSSINEIRDDGVLQGYSTRFFFNGLVSASIVANVNGPIANVTIQQDGTKLNTASFNDYTASTAASQSIFSASVATSISQSSATFNAFSASQNNFNLSVTASLAELLNLSSSLSGGYVTEGELNQYTQSVNQALALISNATGSYATTGSNTFIGDEAVRGLISITGQTGGDGRTIVLGHSGSLVIGNSTTNATYNDLSFISSSVGNANTNLIFKTNTNTTGITVSGSANLFVPPSAPTAEFKRYLGGSGNIALLAAAMPQITGSNQISPTFNNNIFQGNSVFMRTPVSSSAWTISGNSFNNFGNINFGTAQATSFVSASAGVTVSNNFVGGTLSQTAYKTQLYSPVAVIQSYFGGTLTINNDSSSVQFVNSSMQGALTIHNSYNAGTTTQFNSLGVNAGNVFMGTNNTIYASGSNTTTSQQRQFQSSALIGSAHSASVVLNGDNAQLTSTALIGHALVVTGSSALTTTQPTAADRGTVIVGRFNAPLQSGNTVFAVGTGTSTSARKNGFLIDSGSNSIFEGSLTITGSVYGNVSASTITSSTASIDLSTANYFTLTMSGPTNINVINPRAGVTATLVINTSTSATASFSSNVKQPSGSLYVASPSGNVDIISFTAVNSSTVYAFPAQSFV